MLGDLHCHTRLSDGSNTIEDLIFYARRGGLDFIGLVDRDTLSGVTRAEVLGSRYGLQIIGGAEFSAWDPQRERPVDILCYLPLKPDRLLGICNRLQSVRNQAGHEMLKKVMVSYPITAEHVGRLLSGGRVLMPEHIMWTLMDLGYTDQLRGDLYRRLFDPEEGSCFVAAQRMDARKVIGAIHTAGGFAVMANPMKYRSLDLLQELAEKGELDRVEIRAPHISPEAEQVLEGIADRYSLIKTGGTDFRGANSLDPYPLGSFLTPPGQLELLFQRPRHGQ